MVIPGLRSRTTGLWPGPVSVRAYGARALLAYLFDKQACVDLWELHAVPRIR